MVEAKQTNKQYHLINMADVFAREVDWIWFPYIPLNLLTEDLVVLIFRLLQGVVSSWTNKR